MITRRSFLAVSLLTVIAASTLHGEDLKPGAPTKFVADASKLTLLEGLPHPVWEKDLLAQELKAKETQEIQKFPFYKQPIAITAQDRENLRLIFASPDTYAPHSGAKRCGGFHPDYALKWESGERTVQIFVCYGCNELQVIFGDNPVQTYDIGADAGKKLGVALQFRVQRPVKK